MANRNMKKMAKGKKRPCPCCGGAHVKKSTAKACCTSKHGNKPWSLGELGIESSARKIR